MILGSHVSFGVEGLYGSAKQASEYGANTFMFYTGAPQNTVRKPLDEEMILKAHQFMEENGINRSDVVCHAPYIINLANKNNLEKWQFGISFLKQEIARCEKMGISKIVVHPGSAVGITHEEGIQNIVEALNLVLEDTNSCQIFLETMAGKGTECGCTLEEIKALLDGIQKRDQVMVCLDTCHLNDAGYDMTRFSEFLEEFDQKIGITKIGCVHLNDSKNPIGSHKDRHENLGFGTIGFEALLKICENPKLESIPKILETPFVGKTKEDKKRLYPPYAFEINMLKVRKFDPEMLEKIREHYKNA